ncbi:hypothetical protein ACFY9S_15570 [Streptomyces sp. NPDC012474]|uniref:hypothetical protein n=1 Tax=Streptomyces sp. NPDC012474 TaxID=3364836 RepID=UPI0036E62559
MTTRHPERHTEHLRLRRWSEADLDALAETDPDPDVMRQPVQVMAITREEYRSSA